MLIKAGKRITAALFAVMLGASPASALLIGAGQSATMDFDFSASQPAIDASSQPLTLSFTMTTSALDPFDDPAGLFAFQYLDIGAVPVVNFGYDATGGDHRSGTSVDQRHDHRSCRKFADLAVDGEHRPYFDISMTFGAQDFNGTQIIPTSSLSLPNTVDVQIPEPGTLAVLGLGLACLGYSLRRRPV